MLIPMYLLIGTGAAAPAVRVDQVVIFTMIGVALDAVAIFYVYVKAAPVLGGYTHRSREARDGVVAAQAQVWCFAALRWRFASRSRCSRCTRGCPMRTSRRRPRLGDPGRRDAEVRHLWLPAHAFPAVPPRRDGVGAGTGGAGGDGIIYGALVAFAQDDVKKLVAYSSVSHLGFCMLGVVAMSTMA